MSGSIGVRGPGLRTHVLVWLAVRSRASTRTNRVAIFVVTAMAIVLGGVGFASLDADLGPLDIAYGVAALFVLSGTDPGGDVPVALQVARLLAPLATAGATLSLLAALGRGRLNGYAARRSRRHLVVIGPGERVRQYVSDAAEVVVVHHDHGHQGPIGHAVHATPALSGSGWLADLSAANANRIVVATGSDEANIALLGPLTELTNNHPDVEVIVEVDDSPTAAALAATLVAQSPDNHIQVICRDDLAAELAAARALATIRRLGPSMHSAGFGTTVILAGDGPNLSMLGTYVNESLRRAYPGGGRAPRPEVWFMAASAELRRELGVAMADPVNLDVRVCAGTEHLPDVGGAMIFVVAYEDPADSMRAAVRLKARFLKAEVCVRTRATQPAAGLVPLNLDAAFDSLDVGGPWARAAALWCQQAGGIEWSALSPRSRRGRTAEVRLLLNRLIEQGWELGPRFGPWDGEVMLPAATMDAVGDTGHVWRDFPWVLSGVGFALRAPGSRVLPPDAFSRVAAIGDDQVDRLAQLAHQAYQAANQAVDTDGRHYPAAETMWAQLGPLDRAQNIQQVRHAIMRLLAAGLLVVPTDSGGHGAEVDLDDDLVDELARAEHDRWARLKRAQGFRYGPEDVRVGVKRSPDLVAWEDLDGTPDEPEVRRQKDRDPILRLPANLSVVGLRIARPAQSVHDPGLSGR